MALSTQNMVDARRHMGYGFYGSTGNVSLMYWRYFPEYNTLEYRLNNLATDEENVLINTYLPTLNQLEMQSAAAGNGTSSDTLSTDQAAVWTHNKNEVDDRIGLYNYYRKLLCNVMQVPPGPYFGTARSSVRMYV